MLNDLLRIAESKTLENIYPVLPADYESALTIMFDAFENWLNYFFPFF